MALRVKVRAYMVDRIWVPRVVMVIIRDRLVWEVGTDAWRKRGNAHSIQS